MVTENASLQGMLATTKEAYHDLKSKLGMNARAAYNLATQGVENIGQTMAKHPIATRVALVGLPIIVYGLKAATIAAAEGDPQILEDAIIQLIQPGIEQSDVTVYGIEGNGDLEKISHGIHMNEDGLDIMIRDYQNDAHSEYLVLAGDTGYVQTDQMLAEQGGNSLIDTTAQAREIADLEQQVSGVRWQAAMGGIMIGSALLAILGAITIKLTSHKKQKKG